MNISSDLKLETHDYNKIYKNVDLIQKLRALTIHNSSGMNHELDTLSRRAGLRTVKCKVLTAILNTDIVGWALLSREQSTFFFPKQLGYDPADGTLFEVFIDPKYRRKGIGSELLKLARKKAGPYPLCIAPHDNASHSFYENFKHYHHKEI